MEREPKVACVEIDCPFAEYDKRCLRCFTCRPREVYATAIEIGGLVVQHPARGGEAYRALLAEEKLRRLFG